jgi:hypothetical protein
MIDLGFAQRFNRLCEQSEEAHKALERALSSPSGDFARLQQLATKITRIETALNQATLGAVEPSRPTVG